MRVTFLEAAQPLTKTITPEGKTPYPMVKNFTSHEENITDISGLFKAITAHAKQGHCLLKGTIQRPLVKESRQGATKGDAPTQWVCLDFDRHTVAATGTDIDSELTRLGIGDVSYVLQYSASHGLKENEGTISAHVFMLLDSPVPAPTLKAWLMDKNLSVFHDDLRLSRSKNTLSWPLDITTCQNDKLLYIAPPTFKGMKDPLGTKQPRISLVVKKCKTLAATRVGEKHINALKQDERKALNELRKAEGLPQRTARTTWVGAIEVINKPDHCTVTDIKEGEDFIRLNLNGGDSWAYWHAKDNFELIHCFKDDTWYKTKELLPAYYKELCDAKAALTSTPTEQGDLILAFRDIRSSDYFNGIWNPTTGHLELYRAKNETQLDHWMRSHGRTLGDFIPVWRMEYLPREEFVVDEDNHVINTFTPSKYMKMKARKNDDFPTIKKIICHMIGVTPQHDPDKLYEHWVNWFACLFQRKQRPITSWVTHGTQGTGKGYVFNKIIKPLLGESNVASMLAENVESEFNGWLEGKLFAFIDEVDVDDFREKGRVSAKLKNNITEPTISIRHMRRTAYNAPNTVQFMFSSNMPQPVHIPEDDRRYNVGEYQSRKLPPPKDEVVEKELHAFAEFLLAHKADIEYANSIVHTEARERIQKLGVTSLVETCRIIKNGDFDALWMARPDEKTINNSGSYDEWTINAQAYCMLLKDIVKSRFDGKLTRDELYVMLQYNVGKMPRTPNKFTALLRHNNIVTEKIRKGDITAYGIEVKWKVSDALREELEQTLKQSKEKRLRVVGEK